MKPLKTKVSITLDTDVIETIKDLAENDDRSFLPIYQSSPQRLFSPDELTKKGMSN